MTRIEFDTPNGTLSGLLYMPKGASAEDPRPTVVVTHGYLNSAEMQDANAIELNRRGYVVLALDQYDHGHSDLNDTVYTGTSFMEIWAPFWINSMHDAVAYMYEQPYVLKDAAGNGIIGVTGHSMGGFGSTMAIAMDEQEAAETGIRKISCGLTEGSDFLYTGFFGVDAAAADALGGGRVMGKVAAQYDEFFFNAPDAPEGTVRKKDFVSTPDGMAFLQQTSAAQANTWYDTSDGGRRIVYEPAQTHPWNHFSKNTTAYAIEFYTEAFKDNAGSIKSIPATNQLWQFKEGFECLALVGFVMLILGVASLLIELPFFKLAKTEEIPLQAKTGPGKAWLTALILLIAIVVPGLVFAPLMDGGVESLGMKIMHYAGIAVGAGGLIALVVNLIKNRKAAPIVGSLLMMIAGAGLAVFSKFALYQDYSYWTAPGLNSIAYWTLGCALISACITTTVFVLIKSRDGATFKTYGIRFKPMAIIASLCTAVVSVAVAYGVLFLMDLIFKADFRIWTFAFKTFDANICPAILRYLPTFLMFYIISTIGITINTNTERMKGFPGYILAILLNAGGAILWLAVQYGKLFSTGVSIWPGSALSGIVLVAMVPTLSIAAIISSTSTRRRAISGPPRS
ncbi:MAG: alpha/beta fold hydrolase [Clostridia bacterium]|nr:alpha/beta fold hydrolase [Clostridia bacterium]